jgi:thiosulfate dehydrogenase
MRLVLFFMGSAGVFVAAALFLASPAILAADKEDEEYHRDYIYGVPENPTEAWILSSGGRLYDNWINALDAEKPSATHPAWPASNTKHAGASTWRCKSCHGWDLRGKDGAYSKGSYQTGITGVGAWAGKDPEEIHKILMNDTHGFTHDMIPLDAMLRIAAFVSRGQADVAAYIGMDKSVKGNAERGAAKFQTICASCHGFDGTALDWGDSDEPGFVGTEANANPWEVLHKIRAGHPGVEMVSMAAFPLEDALDILAYTQTLPVK